MNIQQALNRSLISAAGSVYFTDQILEKTKQSDFAEKQAAEEAKQANDTEFYENQILGINSDGISEDEETARNKVSNKEGDIAERRLKRANKKFQRWRAFYPGEVADIESLYKAKSELETAKSDHKNETYKANEPIRWLEAPEEAKPVVSLQNKVKTYTDTNDAMNERIDTLHSGTYKSRMHQPSVRMEE